MNSFPFLLQYLCPPRYSICPFHRWVTLDWFWNYLTAWQQFCEIIKKKLITVLQKQQYLIKALIQMTILIPAWSSCYRKTRKCRNSKIEMKHKNIIRNIINKKLTRKYNYRINKKIYLNIALSDNPLSVNVPFLYPLKMSENKFSDIFRRIEKV